MKSNKKLFKLTLVSIMAITLSGCNFNIHWGGSSSSNSTSDSSSENELISSSSDINSANSSKDSEYFNTESSSEISSESSSEPSSESSSEISSESSSEHSSLEQSSSSSSESSVSSTNSSHSSSENKKSYSITYVYNDNVTQNKTIDNLYVMPSLESPSREGYLFEGWYYDSTFIDKASENDELYQNEFLYASWSKLDLDLKEMYCVGFESEEGYQSITSYNNPDLRILGSKMEWSISMGNASTTDALKDDQSLQMRYYNSKSDKIGCLISNYSFNKATMLSFYGKSLEKYGVNISKSYDGNNWTGGQVFFLTNEVKEYYYDISTEGEDVFIRFDLVLPTNVIDKKGVILDDIKIFGNGSGINIPSIDVDYGSFDMSNIPLSVENVYSNLSKTGSDDGGISESQFNTIKEQVNTYYASVSETYKGELLWDKLNEVTYIPSNKIRSYSELKTDLLKTDYSTSNPNKIIDMYSGLSFTGTWDAEVWNREHIWCQSHSWYSGVSESSRNAGTDLHHIRPLYKSINSSRNNSLYGEILLRQSKAKYFNENDTVNATASNGTLYGYLDDSIDPVILTKTNEGVFEPTDRVKGDVARILMYILIRYPEYNDKYPITNIIYTSEGTISSAYALLLKWHQQDPVSNFEIRRNQKTYEIQGNRNPFIDNPTYADLVFRNL